MTYKITCLKGLETRQIWKEGENKESQRRMEDKTEAK